MSVRDRIISFLQIHPEGIDDDELAKILNLSSRQQANIVCRALEEDGYVTRRELYGKIHNFWNAQSQSPKSFPSSSSRFQELSPSHDEVQQYIEKHQKKFSVIDIEKNTSEYINGNNGSQGIKPQERYASFDYCFNYFHTFHEKGELPELVSPQNIQQSCLQLGFYLASWGMLRGSSFLINKSVKVFETLIQIIADTGPDVWEIDAHCYTQQNIAKLMEFKQVILQSLPYGNGPSDTLVSKIMLGVFGNVPAFDSYFCRGFSTNFFNKKSLEKISSFYQSNRKIIDRCRIPTIDYWTGKPTSRLYTRAKMIDMIFFVEGSR